MRILGIPLGSSTLAFELMRNLHGLEIDIYYPEYDISLMRPCIYRKFREIEKETKAGEYFSTFPELNDYWKEFLEWMYVLSSNGEVRKVSLENYAVIAISSTDQYWIPLNSFLRYLEQFDIPIAIGGCLIRGSTLTYLKQLANRYWINFGSFKKFMRALESDEIRPGVVIDDWIFRIASSEMFKNSGLVKYEKVTDTKHDACGKTMQVIGEGVHAKIIGLTSCKNACDYCSSRRRIAVPLDLYLLSLEEMNGEYCVLDVIDDNPFQRVEMYYPIFFRAKRRNGKIIWNSYLDPAEVSTSPSANEFLEKLLRDKQVTKLQLFIGRECADEEASETIGRCYLGRTRDQELLNREKKFLTELLKRCSGNERYEIVISYIIGPYSEDSIRKIFEEVEEFLSIANGNLEIHLNPLHVHPGTKCFQRYKNQLLSPFPGVCLSNLEHETIRNFEELYFQGYGIIR